MRTLLLILLFLPSAAVFSQGDTMFRASKLFPGTATDFAVDNLGNIFILYQNGQLKKFSPFGDSLAVFNDVRRYGRLHSIDVTNPLKILLYYKDFGTIVVLDRFLTPRTTVDLRKQGLFQVKAISQSYDNNIWVFDEMESKLKRIGDDGKLIDQFNDFRLVFDTAPSPQYIVDQNKNLYLYDSLRGAYIFDYYGALKNRIPLMGWSDFLVIEQALYGRDHHYIYRYEPGSLNLQRYRLPAAMLNSRKMAVLPGRVYVLGDKGVQVFLYK